MSKTTYIGFSNSRVLGNLELDNFSGTYNGTSTGSATGNTREECEAAANNAATKIIFALILAKLDELLVQTTFPYKKVLNLIQNNVATDSKIYELLQLSQIATTNDGLNYFLKTQNILKFDQYSEVKADQTLTGGEGIYTIDNGLLNLLGQLRLGEISSNPQPYPPTTGGKGIFLGVNSGILLTEGAGITLTA